MRNVGSTWSEQFLTDNFISFQIDLYISYNIATLLASVIDSPFSGNPHLLLNYTTNYTQLGCQQYCSTCYT